MKSANFLPKAFRLLFAIFAVCTALAAILIVGVIVVDPSLPSDAHFGPAKGELFGQAAEFALYPAAGGSDEPVFSAKAFNGNLALNVEKTGGLVALLKQYGLPLMLTYALFFAALFELLRRLFRNVGLGNSFTPQSVRLVQSIGVALIMFWLVSGLAESWFVHAAWNYFSQHTEIAVSGTPIRLPPATDDRWFGQVRIFDWVLFSGLLVLALAEVFRQGLALKRDADLTV